MKILKIKLEIFNHNFHKYFSKINMSTNPYIHTICRPVFPNDFSWKSRLLSQKITKITNKKTPPKSRKSQAKDLKISEKSRTFFENVLV